MKRIVLVFTALLLVFFSLMGSQAVSASPLSTTLALTPGYPVGVLKDWTKTWGGAGNDAVHNAVTDKAGNLYLAGEFAGTVDFDPDPVKTDIHSSFNGTTDVFLSKFAPDGTFLWAKTWGGGSGTSGRDVANGLGVDSSGNVYVSGPFQYTVDFDPDPAITRLLSSNGPNGGSTNNIFLSKFSPTGALLWVKTWGPTDSGGESYNLALDSADNVFVVGDFSGTAPVDFNPWGAHDWHTNHQPIVTGGLLLFDAFLSKFDSNGNFQWAKTWGGEGYDDGPGVAVDKSGNIYVTGMYGSTVIDFDPAGGGVTNHPAHDSGFVVDGFLSKFAPDGTFQWVKTWGGPGVDDIGEVVAFDSANNIYVTGRFGCAPCDFNPGGTPDMHSSYGDLDAFVFKLDASGAYQWGRSWGGLDWDAPGSLALDQQGNVYISGFFTNLAHFDPGGKNSIQGTGREAFLIQFSPAGSYQWVKTWGGSGDDSSWSLVFDQLDNLYVVGSFMSTVDFNPDGGVDSRTSSGKSDAFVSKFLAVSLTSSEYLPMVAAFAAP